MKIKEVKAFKVSSAVKEKLAEIGFAQTFAQSEEVLRENDYIRDIPIVISGSLKVLQMEDEGRELLLYYLKPGDSCIMSFLGGIHHEKSKVKVIAEELSEVFFVPIEKLGFLMKEYPEWLNYIFELYHKRFEELLEVINAIAFKKLDERLLNFLETKAEIAQSDEINITHEQLANELGTSRVVVSRLLKKMEEEGIVVLGRNRINLRKNAI